MGLYISQTSKGLPLDNFGKAQALIKDGAIYVTTTFVVEAIDDAPDDDAFSMIGFVCVVENAMFEAAAYADTRREAERFLYSRDDRRKTWLQYPHAKQVAGWASHQR